MIDHVTYHMTNKGLVADDLDEMMKILGFIEVEPDDPFEHGYQVRWFAPLYRTKPWIHFVADGRNGDLLRLGHFCIITTKLRFKWAAESRWCVRDSGSGRIWLEHDAVRIEVRPS